MNKRLFTIIFLSVMSFSLLSCGKKNELVEENAQEVANDLSNSDIGTINQIIFGTNEFEVDEALSDIWEENDQSQEGILASVFELVTVEVKKVTESKIEYKIEAPDMSKVFDDIDINYSNISENELAEYIIEYAQDAKIKSNVVSLDHILVEDEPVVNYQDEKFINAMTGGLLDVYKTLYSEMMKEYTEGVK